MKNVKSVLALPVVILLAGQPQNAIGAVPTVLNIRDYGAAGDGRTLDFELTSLPGLV